MKPFVFRLKPSLLKIHRWLGLAIGLFVLTQAATGCVVAFRDELKRVLFPQAMVVPPDEGVASLQSIVSAAKAATRNAPVTRIDYPRQPDDAYFVTSTAAGSGDMLFSAVDHQGRVTRSGGLFAWPTELAFHVHYQLASGPIGGRIVGFTGLWVLLMAITGLFYWWPGAKRLKQGFNADLGHGAYRATRGLHRVAGVVMAPVLVVIAFTGMTMAWQSWITPLVSAVAIVTPSPAPKAALGQCSRMPALDDAVRAAIAVRPGQIIKSVRLKGKAGHVVAVYFQAKHAVPSRLSDHVWVDGCTAKILATEYGAQARSGDRFFDWLLPIHSGDWLGWPGRLLSFAGALTLFFLVCAGYGQWISRTRKLRKARAERGTGPDKGRRT